MTDFIKTNYHDIERIDYTNDYEVNPMGGIEINGYLNGNKKKNYGESMIKVMTKSYLSL